MRVNQKRDEHYLFVEIHSHYEELIEREVKLFVFTSILKNSPNSYNFGKPIHTALFFVVSNKIQIKSIKKP